MSANERHKRAKRATQEGREARRAGEPIEANPYKKSTWGMGGFWEAGWQDAGIGESAVRQSGGER